MNKTIIELRYIFNMVDIHVSEVFIIVLHSNQPGAQHWADDPWWSEFELSWKNEGFPWAQTNIELLFAGGLPLTSILLKVVVQRLLSIQYTGSH